MPRGPHDEEIDERNPDADHAQKRRNEFIAARLPVGVPPESEDTPQEEKNVKLGKPKDPGAKP